MKPKLILDYNNTMGVLITWINIFMIIKLAIRENKKYSCTYLISVFNSLNLCKKNGGGIDNL